MNDSVVRIIYGLNPVSEALRARRAIRALYVDRAGRNPALAKLVRRAEAAHVAVKPCEPSHLFRLCDSKHHQGVVAETAPLANGSLTGLLKDRPEALHTILLLDRVQDPQNLGNIFRSAEAAGVSLVFLPSRGAASHQLGSVAKASAGAVEHVPAVVVSNLAKPAQELREAGFRIFGLDQNAKQTHWEAVFGPRSALFVGAEGSGLGGPARQLCDELVSVPMRGKVDSLNVTNAVAVVLYEILRQRRG